MALSDRHVSLWAYVHPRILVVFKAVLSVSVSYRRAELAVVSDVIVLAVLEVLLLGIGAVTDDCLHFYACLL